MGCRPLVLCLLPVRNGETLLPGWFESIARFADGVLALDDGSTDDTPNLLESNPFVLDVINNPVRPGYEGWDDARNRTRLLAAAERLRPRWIMWLDADERIDDGDARALRTFVERDAVPGLAYGFRVHRMIESVDTYDRAALWVYRLFAHEPGQRLPSARLHFVPIPTSIPRKRWVKTSIRIQHLAGLTERDRRARHSKYLEADAGGVFQRNYDHLLDEPEALRPWHPRPAGQPVLVVDSAAGRSEDLHDCDGPVLSVIAMSRDDDDPIEQCVRSIVDQDVAVPFETVVMAHGRHPAAESLRQSFPEVRLVEMPESAPPGRVRNAGMAVARGEYVCFVRSDVELPTGSLAARLEAHEQGWAMVTGTAVNADDSFAGWASYFLDHSGALPGRPPTALEQPPADCSYRASLLDDVEFPVNRRSGEDAVVNRELFRRGHGALHDPAVRVFVRSPARSVRGLVGHYFGRGQAVARMFLEPAAPSGLLRDGRFRRRMGPRFIVDQVRQTDRNVEQWGGELVGVYQRVRVGVITATTATWLGAWCELLRPRPGWRRSLLAPPARVTKRPDRADDGPTRVVQALTTAYCPCARCCGEWAGGLTAMQVDTKTGVRGAAADFGLLPPGTIIDVPGYGRTVVDDTGGRMRENARAGILHIDLRFATHEEALAWGVRWCALEVPASAGAAALAEPGPDTWLLAGANPQ